MLVLDGAYIIHISVCIYEGFTMLNITSNLYQSAMASVNFADHLSRFDVIRADGEGILISFPLGSDGMAMVTAIRLGL
jgi:hypothetical protein